MIDWYSLWRAWWNHSNGDFVDFINSRNCEIERAFLQECITIQRTEKYKRPIDKIMKDLANSKTPLGMALK